MCGSNIMNILQFIIDIFAASWDMLLNASAYIIFGILAGGLLKVFLSPATVARHLGHGRFLSVIKASLFGIPLPLCSCGVLPAAASLKKQGANSGATTAFLISTPESGIDSISITYALLDPIMTVARPIAAFCTAIAAGITENLMQPAPTMKMMKPDLSCPVDNCCDGTECHPEEHKKHHSLPEKLVAGLKFAFGELWEDLAGWFYIGILLSGIITVLVPDTFMSHYLGGGLSSMLIMLAAGIPLYICATASTPIAAALILKGVSPGAALVFLLAGPATNVTSLSVLIGFLGRRATIVLLAIVSVMSILAGLLVDLVYGSLGITARAVTGQAAELIPYPLQFAAALFLLLLSIKPIAKSLQNRFQGGHAHSHDSHSADNCGCSSNKCALDDKNTTK